MHSLEYCEFTQWWAGGDLKSKTAPFDKPFELILNLAVGGNLPGAMAVSDIPEAAMPMKMEIEYVRVFELTAEELAYENPFPGPVLPVSAADKQRLRSDSLCVVSCAVLPVVSASATVCTAGTASSTASSAISTVPSAYNVDPTTLKRVAWNIASGGMRIDAELFDYGGQGVGYFDKDPLVNNGNAALRKNEGVEVSEDNVWIAPDAWKFVDSAGAYITLDKASSAAGSANTMLKLQRAAAARNSSSSSCSMHSTLTGSGFKIIVDSTNCKDPTLDGGAVVLEVAETTAAYIPGPGLTPPKSYGFLPKCWHTERWLTLPIKTPGEHVLTTPSRLVQAAAFKSTSCLHAAALAAAVAELHSSDCAVYTGHSDTHTVSDKGWLKRTRSVVAAVVVACGVSRCLQQRWHCVFSKFTYYIQRGFGADAQTSIQIAAVQDT
eukprot:11475-Heterococcus_DN1.PRE.3